MLMELKDVETLRQFHLERVLNDGRLASLVCSKLILHNTYSTRNQ